MSYASVMVYVAADAMPEQLVRLGASLADTFNAVLIGLSARAMPPPVVADGMVIDEPTDVDIGLIGAKLADKGKWFNGIARAEQRRVEWRFSLDLPIVALTREARSADLVLLGQKMKAGDAYNALDPGGAILKLGRPTLVVPEGVSVLRAEHVVIGWKDTREARRAVRDALPFLHRATRVTVVEACGPGEEKSALDRTRRRQSLPDEPPHQGRAQGHAGAEGIRCRAVASNRPGGARRSADHGCLRTQPARGVDLRRYDARIARDQSDLLPHVSLISQGACALAEVVKRRFNRFPKKTNNTDVCGQNRLARPHGEVD